METNNKVTRKRRRLKICKLLKVIMAALLFLFIVYFSYRFFISIFVNKLDDSKNIDANNDGTEKIKEDEEEEKEIYPKIYNISLIMAGDALFHEAVYFDGYKNEKFDFKPMLSLIKPIIEKHDLAFYNQETILGGREIGLSTYPRFNSPQEVGDAFLDAGFNIVALANNHTLDRGEQAIINARKYWNSKEVLVNGSASSEEERNKIDIKEVNNIKYAMLSYTTSTNGIYRNKDYFVNIYNEEIVKKDIERVRSLVDVLMVSMHWGNEYYHGITNEQRNIANYLSSLGVDIIIGHHPHVVEPIEYIDDTLVIYSLGNIISAQVGIERLTGLMVSLDIQKIVDKEEVKMVFGDPSAELIYTYSLRNPGRNSFKIYPYSKLNDSLLPGYKNYYDYYMNIVASKSDRVIKVPLEG